jgi:hypothetical protein
LLMVFRLIYGLLALLFLFGAAVQYNDPDPLAWMAIYLAASAASIAAVLHRCPVWLPALVAVVAIAWALMLAPRAFPNVQLPELFAAWEMKNERVEEGREMYGLLIICAAMVPLVVKTWRSRRLNGA